MLDVIYEDNHLLAINKPAGLATMGAEPGLPTVVERAREYLRRKYNKPGNVYIGVVSRLDAHVSGVLLLARTSKAAGRLTEQFRSRRVRKEYWAVVSGEPSPREGTWRDWLLKDDGARRMTIAEPHARGAREAVLHYRVLRRLTAASSLVAVDLETGRKHQVRVQFASRNHAVAGDRKYGSRLRFRPGIALHARVLELTHPVRKTPLRLEVPPPESWHRLGLPGGAGGEIDQSPG